MKKVLFATTALVATAGVAAADVTFGGYGRFGVIYSETNAVAPTGDATQIQAARDDVAASRTALEQANDDADAARADGTISEADLQAVRNAEQALADDLAILDAIDGTAGDDSVDITSRFRLQIDATAESDAGVTFGARVRIQQNNTDNSNDPAGTGINGARFFARSGGLEVGVGNIYGALEFMPGMYPIDLGLTGLAYEYTAYNFRGDAYSSGGSGAAGANGVEVMYSFGDLSVHVSASDDEDRIAGHVAYTWNGWTFALGAQDSDADRDTELAASIGGSFGPADVTLAYAKNGDDNGVTTFAAGRYVGTGDHLVLAARFDVGAATNVEAYVADADYFAETSYGIDFNHDLGGGTSLRGGVASRGNDTVIADMGVRFNF